MLVVISPGVCGRWYPVTLVLHQFFIAISRAVVNHDGFGWSGLLVLCPREGGLFMLSVTWLCFLDLLLFGLVIGFAGPAVTIGVDGVAQWPLHSWSSG